MKYFERKLAITIGINQYGHGIAPLQTAVQDAQILATTLKSEHGYQVTELLDEAATLGALRELFEEKLPQLVTDQDCLLVYFAGHGIAKQASKKAAESEALETKGPVGYLIPQNARPEDEGSFWPMQDMYQAVEKLPCRHFLLILDCCFAGAFRWATTRDVVVPEEMYRERFLRFKDQAAWQVLTSASYDQKALDILRDNRGIVRGDHSPFAAALIEALTSNEADMTKDDVITATELYLHLRDFVEVNSKERQTPGLWPLPKHDRGEYFFLTKEFNEDGLTKAPELNPENNPYRGLKAYEPRHGAIFFGRDRLITRLYRDYLKPNDVRPTGLTVVVGASGTGKSSLVKAGLVSYLTKEAFLQRRQDFKAPEAQVTETWELLPMVRPSNDPLLALAQALFPLGSEPPSREDRAAVATFDAVVRAKRKAIPTVQVFYELWQPLADKPKERMVLALAWEKSLEPHLDESARQSLAVLRDQASEAVQRMKAILQKDEAQAKAVLEQWLAQRPQTQVLWVIDQAEELITQCRDEAARQRFMDYLEWALTTHSKQLHAVLTVRMDFEPLVQGLFSPAWQTDWMEKYRLVVPPMTQDDLRQAIEGPANEKALYFDPASLVDELINEVVQMPGALPLLSFVLSELYLKCVDRWRKDGDNQRALIQKDYEKLDKVSGALRSRANEEFNALDEAGQRTLRNIMLRMVALEGGELARRRVSKTELEYAEPEEQKRVEDILDRLIEQRLVIAGRSAEGEYVEPAHDVLVRGWEKIAEWQEHLGTLILQRDLTSGANEWEASAKKGRDTGLLWVEDPRLSTALQISCGRAYKDNWINLFRWRLYYRDWQSKSYEHWLNIKESNFVWQSFKQKFNRFGRNSLIITGTIFALSGLTLEAWRRAEIAQLREQSARVINLLSTDSAVPGLILAIDTMDRSLSVPSVAITAQNALLNAVQVSQEINRIEGHKDWVTSVAFSPNGQRIVSGSWDGSVRLWDVQSGQPVAQLIKNHEEQINSVAFSPDGGHIVSGSADGVMQVWNAENFQAIGKIIQLEDGINSVAFSSDGQHIVSGGTDGVIRIWDAQSGQSINEFRGHREGITSVTFSPDSQRIASGGWDGVVRLWNAQSGQTIDELQGHKDWVTSVAFSSDGQHIVSGGRDGVVQLWDAQSGQAIGEPLKGHGVGAWVTSVAFSPNGQRIVSSSGNGEDGTVLLWDTQSGQPIGEPFRGHGSEVTSVAFSPDGQRIVSGSWDGSVRLWDAHPTGQAFQVESAVLSIGYSPDGQRIVSGHGDGTIQLWDVQSSQPIGEPFRGHGAEVTSVAFSPDGQRIVSGSRDEVVRLWDIQSSQPIGEPLKGHEDWVTSVVFSPDGQRIISGGRDNKVRMWDAQSGQSIGDPLEGHGADVYSVAFSPNGRHIVSGSGDGTVQLWDAQSRQPISEPLKGHGADVYSVAFSPDGQRIISGGRDNKVRMWDAQSGQSIGDPLEGHEGWVYSVAFSPDGQHIVSGSWDKTVRLWDARSGQPIGKPFQGHTSEVYSVAFSSDGTQIVSSSLDNTIRLWNFSSKKLLEVACERLRVHPLLNQPETITTNQDFLEISKRTRLICQKRVLSDP